ncbi:PGG domain [Sesbania bispinosa]|nr:PGG domain [Sesbania bispinosa]
MDGPEIEIAWGKIKQDKEFIQRRALADEKSEVKIAPSEVTLKVCGENENLELLREVYHLAHGGPTNWLHYSSISTNLHKIKTPSGNTVLHVAAWNGNDDVVDLIAKHAPNLLFLDNLNKDTVLHVAARVGKISTVQRLLEAYANFNNPKIAEAWINYMGDDDMTHKDYDASQNMKGLLEFVKRKNNQGNTMLHEAMMCSKSVGGMIFQVLESYKARTKTGESLSEHCYIFPLDIVNNAKQSALYLAVEAGNEEAVKLILDKCPNKYLKPEGLSPLVAAIMKQDQGMLGIILNKKHDWIHLMDKDERLALHYAASEGFCQGVIDLLEKCNCCSIKKDKYGFFPLHLASHGGHVEVVKNLLGYCPDPTQMLDSSGRNILHIAAKNGKHRVVRYILQTYELEGMINQKDIYGNTPLHLATKWCHPKTVYYLTWDHRLNLNLVNLNMETPLDISQKSQFTSLRDLLTWRALKSADAKPSSRKVIPVKTTPSDSNPIEKSKKMESIKVKVVSTGWYKDRANTFLPVSTLIITASVAACLAVPGEADGPANNLCQHMFQFFIFCITISLFSSISATIILFRTRLEFIEIFLYIPEIVMPLLGVSLISLSLAFMAGVYTVISNLKWLVNIFLVMTIILVLIVSFLCIIFLLAPSPSTSKPLRCISHYPFILLTSLIEPNTNRNLNF